MSVSDWVDMLDGEHISEIVRGARAWLGRRSAGYLATEDVQQEAALRLWERWDEWRGVPMALAVVRCARLMRRLAIDAWRAESCRHRHEAAAAVSDEVLGDEDLAVARCDGHVMLGGAAVALPWYAR